MVDIYPENVSGGQHRDRDTLLSLVVDGQTLSCTHAGGVCIAAYIAPEFSVRLKEGGASRWNLGKPKGGWCAFRALRFARFGVGGAALPVRNLRSARTDEIIPLAFPN
jgi:hypothetical protein